MTMTETHPIDGKVIPTNQCATDGCYRTGTERFEAGGVGSIYCPDCAATIRQIKEATTPPAQTETEKPAPDGLEIVAWECTDLVMGGEPSIVTDVDHAAMRKLQPKAWAVEELVRRSQAQSVIAELRGERDEALAAYKAAHAEVKRLTEENEGLRKRLNEIRELNMTAEDENGHRWANSDLIDQTIMLALSTLNSREKVDG